MVNPLREPRLPSDLAASGQLIEFTEELGDFEGLAEVVEADLAALDPVKLPPLWRESKVAGRLKFGVATAHDGQPVLEGQVTATIAAVCQRCLEPFRLPLDVPLRLAFVAAGDEDRDCGDYEVWELEDELLRPIDVVQETLIMALPFVAMHDDTSDCGKRVVIERATAKTTRPFADLKAQMEKEE